MLSVLSHKTLWKGSHFSNNLHRTNVRNVLSGQLRSTRKRFSPNSLVNILNTLPKTFITLFFFSLHYETCFSFHIKNLNQSIQNYFWFDFLFSFLILYIPFYDYIYFFMSWKPFNILFWPFAFWHSYVQQSNRKPTSRRWDKLKSKFKLKWKNKPFHLMLSSLLFHYTNTQLKKNVCYSSVR